MTLNEMVYETYVIQRKSVKETCKMLHINYRRFTKIMQENNWKVRPKHILTNYLDKKYRDKNWLYNEYIILNKTVKQIAEETSYSETAVDFWIGRFNLRHGRKTNKNKKFNFNWRKKLSISKLNIRDHEWTGFSSSERHKIRNSIEYRRWRFTIFERDDYTCQKCRKRGVHLHAHHIKHFAKHENLRLEISNGITLCSKCHYEIHRKDVSGESTILVTA